MGTVYAEIDQKLRDWLLAQPVFFVGTAPLSADGHVNISPKGMDGTFAVLGPHRVGYLDYYGSGAETIAHLRENGRIVIMCCAFAGPPKIVRLHGRGRIILAADPEYAAARRAFGKPRDRGLRSIIVVEVDRIADSCGFSVPLMDFVADRDLLDRSQERREPQYFDQYRATRNAVSIDGLPALAPERTLR
jgi:Pyridoxamine 5'-phosphate oxidase